MSAYNTLNLCHSQPDLGDRRFHSLSRMDYSSASATLGSKQKKKKSMKKYFTSFLGSTNALTVNKYRNRSRDFFDGHVPMEIEAALRQTWSKILGPHYYILVAHITKSRDSGGLGISLEGTVDVDARGVENQPHHYIRKILPQGPVGRDGTLRIKDELLEVNGKKLFGLNYKEVVHILKNLPSHVRLVCARKRYDASASSSSISTVGSDAEFVDTSEIGSTQSSMVTPFKAKSEDSLFSATIPRSDANLKSIRSRSLEHMTGVAIWPKEPLVIELQKDGKGLGFSIVDHVDPYNIKKTIIVIRSLVPGGVAHQDGRIIPGDRLLFVNDRSVEHASLDTAVSILKSAPKGKVMLGIAKALPLHPDNANSVSSCKDIDLKELNDSIPISKQDDTYDQIPPAPVTLENAIVIWHHEGPLDIEVDAVSDGNHGCRIRQIHDPQILKECILQEGDYITEIDSQSLRNISTDQAKIIIDRLTSTKPMDIEIRYISSENVRKHMEYHYNSSNRFNSMHSTSSPLLQSLSNELLNSNKPNDPQQRRPTLTRQRTQSSTNDVEVWASPRIVTINREPQSSLGISIVDRWDYQGCKVTDQEEKPFDKQINIFIKQLTKNSPAERCGQLKPHDRILEVNGVDLRKCSHDDAVNVIRKATSPVRLLVQSLVEPPEISNDVKKSPEELKSNNKLANSEDSLHQSVGDILEDVPAPANVQEAILVPQASIEDENISPAQPSSPDLKDEHVSESEDDEEPDEWGHTAKSVRRQYHQEYPGEILIFRVPWVDKSKNLGLRLAGNKDPQKMNVFVFAIVPNSPIDHDEKIQVGDELLEINGESVVGRSHLNISPIIKRCQASNCELISFVVHRSPDNLTNMAATPVTSTLSFKKQEVQPTEFSSDVKSCKEEIIHVSLVRGSTGLGFFIMDGSMSDEPGIYVKLITPNGVADKEGTLREGDRLISVNDADVTQRSYDETLDLLRKSTGTVRLVVSRPVAPQIKTQTLPAAKRASLSTTKAIVSGEPPLSNNQESQPPANTLPRPSLTSQDRPFEFPKGSEKRFESIRAQIRPSNGSVATPVTPAAEEEAPEETPLPLPRLEIEPGKETEIEITKEDSLGFSIVCGSDKTHGTIIVYEVHENGSADKDGRLETGDRILEVNGTDIKAASHEEAIRVLRNTGKVVLLKVFRDSPDDCKEDHLYELKKVELMKKTKKGLGISIVSKPNVGVIISELVKDSIAEQNGGLRKGDLILEINNENVRESSQQQVATILKQHTGKVIILVGRPKSGGHSRSSSQSRLNKEPKKDVDSDHSIYIGGTDTESTYSNRSRPRTNSKIENKTSSVPENLQSLKVNNKAKVISPTTSLQASQTLRWDVTLIRGSSGLGFTIIGGPDTSLSTYHVKTVVPDGPASKCHIRSGDRILAVNGVLVDSKSRSQVIDMLKTSQREVTLTLTPGVEDVMRALENVSYGTLERS